ncbi:MAG TPA: hypothetical protein VJK51_02285, partial [Candidatus Nanoarchaeia archaeon]|nr:hypothetical protein [Candidatus Nanoarchaeia archaeon]
MFGKNKSKDDKEESKKDRFKRIATRRVNDILYKLRLLGNCANTSVYDYNDEDKRKIFSAIDEELRRAKLAFN